MHNSGATVLQNDRAQKQTIDRAAGAAFISLLLVGVIVFSDFLFSNAQDYPLKFICIPFVVWVAFEMSPRAAALAIVVFAAVAVGRGIALCPWSLDSQ
jgi:integral membrane sensor domain MASE1